MAFCNGCFEGIRRHLPSRRVALHPDPRLPEGAWAAATELPVLPEARQEVAGLLGRREFFRDGYTNQGSPAALCEKKLAEYMGFKYCVAVNSHSSALFVALVAAGVRSGTRVMASALACTTAPSAICQAGGELVLVESLPDMSINVQDLAWKASQTGACYLLLSHLHGCAVNIDEVVQECNARGIVIIEDCADSLGSWYEGRHIGHHGLVCCVSAQLTAVIHCGDGGFAATDDVGLAASMAALSGSYSAEFKMHFAAPESPVFDAIDQGLYPCYSLQMSNVVAAVLRSELACIESRVDEVNRKCQQLAVRFEALLELEPGVRSALEVSVPRPPPGARLCMSSFRFFATLGPRALAAALAAARERGVPLQTLADAGDARGFGAGAEEPGPEAAESLRSLALLGRCLYVRVPPRLRGRQCQRAADVLVVALRAAAAVAAGEAYALPAAPACAIARRLGVRGPLGASEPGASLPRTPLSGPAEALGEASPLAWAEDLGAGAWARPAAPLVVRGGATPTSASASVALSLMPPSARVVAAPSTPLSPASVGLGAGGALVDGFHGASPTSCASGHFPEILVTSPKAESNGLSSPQGLVVSNGAHFTNSMLDGSPVQRTHQDVDVSGTAITVAEAFQTPGRPQRWPTTPAAASPAAQLGPAFAGAAGAGEAPKYLTPQHSTAGQERLTARVCPDWTKQKQGGSQSASPASTPLTAPASSVGGQLEGKLVASPIPAAAAGNGAKFGAWPVAPAQRYTDAKVLTSVMPAVAKTASTPITVRHFSQSGSHKSVHIPATRPVAAAPQRTVLGAAPLLGGPRPAQGSKTGRPLAASRITTGAPSGSA